MAKPYIRTGVYSKDAGEVFRRTFKWISDKDTKHGYSSPNRDLYANVNIEYAADGEVIITTCTHRWTRLDRFTYENGNRAFYPWFAYKIKQCFYDLYGKEHWNRTNNTEVDFMSDPYHEYANLPVFNVPCSAFYFLYEHLLNRKKSASKYSPAVVEKFGGTQNDPILTQAEQQRRDDLKQLECEYDKQKQALDKQRHAEYSAFYAQLDAKYDTLMKDMRLKYEQRRKELEDIKFIA